MLALLETFGIYLGLAITALYLVWKLIGRQGFIGLEDTDSRLAKHFRKSKNAVRSQKPAAYGA